MKLLLSNTLFLLFSTTSTLVVAAAEESTSCPIYRIKSSDSMSWEDKPGQGTNDCLVGNDDFISASGDGKVTLTGTSALQTAQVVPGSNCNIVDAKWKAAGPQHDHCMTADFDSAVAIFDITADLANNKDISHVEIIVECCENAPPPTTTSDAPPLPPLGLRSAGGYGDPHFLQWNGDIVDFHGACDLILLSSPSADMDIHIRTVMMDDWSYIAATAIRLGQDVLEISHHGHHAMNDNSKLPSSIAGKYPLTYERLLASAHKYIIDLNGKGKIEVTAIDKFLSVMVRSDDSTLFGTSVGLIGNFETGASLTRAGVVAVDTNEYGMDWQVTGADPKVFSSSSGPQWPNKCAIPPPATAGRRRRHLLSNKQAMKACAHWPAGQHRDSCIQDVMLTGVAELAQIQVY